MITIILTSYNKARFLPDAINSVFAQSYPDWQLIIVDDKSTDGSYKVAKELAKMDKRIKLVKTDLDSDHIAIKLNRYNHNVNYAMNYAKGDLISYLCDDDWYVPDRLQRMYEFLKDHPEISCCYGKQGMVDE